jgi:hypothetical protein
MASLSVRIGQTAPLLEPVDAPLDRVALLVRLGVEGRRATAGATSPQTVTDLVGRLRNDCADPALAQLPADRTGRIRAIRQDGLRAGSRSATSTPRNVDACHDGLEGRCVARLACGDAEGQGSCRAVAGEMDFCAQTAAGASETVVVWFGAVQNPLFLAPAAC